MSGTVFLLDLFESANAPQALSRNENAYYADDACDVPPITSFRHRNVISRSLRSRYVRCARCASATVDSHGPLVDSVLVVRHPALFL
jgi:hypothetical protein